MAQLKDLIVSGTARVLGNLMAGTIYEGGQTLSSKYAATNHSHPYVTSFNGQTGAVTYTAPVTSVNGQTGDVTVVAGVSSVNGATGAVSAVTSFNGSTGAVTYTAPVISVNGQTGAVTGLQTTSNLVTSLSSSSTDAQYPSAKCVYDISVQIMRNADHIGY